MKLGNRFLIAMMMLLLSTGYNKAYSMDYSRESDVLLHRILKLENTQTKKTDTLISPVNIFEQINPQIFENQNDKKIVTNILKIKAQNQQEFYFLVLLLITCFIVFIKVSDANQFEELIKSAIKFNAFSNLEYTLTQLLLIGNYLLVFSISILLFKNHYENKMDFSDYKLFYQILSIVVFSYFARILILILIGWCFNINKVILQFIKVNNQLNMVCGIFLLPIILLKFYSHSIFADILLYTAITATLINISYKVIKNIMMCSELIVYNIFHFIIYICAVEIIPLLLLNNFLKA